MSTFERTKKVYKSDWVVRFCAVIREMFLIRFKSAEDLRVRKCNIKLKTKKINK